MKSILPLSIVLLFLGCASDEIVDAPIIDIDDSVDSVLTISNSSGISITPFSGPRETIIFENSLYAVDDSSTYRYDFNTNLWETINTNSVGAARAPFVDRNVSFIHDNQWHIFNGFALWSFDFETNVWVKLKNLMNDNLIIIPMGVYDNGSFFVFSAVSNKIYKYNFEDNTFIQHGSFETRSYYSALVKSIFKIGDTYYYARLSNYSRLSIYKWADNFTKFEFLNEFQAHYSLEEGVGFVFNDNIIFGLGGWHSTDENGDYTIPNYSDKLYYYNTTHDEFRKIDNNFYESRYMSLPITHDNQVYLLGGRAGINNEIVTKETLDKIDFEWVEK